MNILFNPNFEVNLDSFELESDLSVFLSKRKISDLKIRLIFVWCQIFLVIYGNVWWDIKIFFVASFRIFLDWILKGSTQARLDMDFSV